jgi:hypothetical protein
MERDDLTEPDMVSDRFVYEVRITHLLGLMGIYGLWRRQRIYEGQEEANGVRDDFLRRFCHEKAKLLSIWGEYAIPQWLAFNFFFRTINATPASDFLYLRLIEVITRANGRRGKGTLANPYYDAESIIPRLLGLEAEPLEDSFARASFLLEGVLHLFIQTNYKQHMKYIFPQITPVCCRSFVPDEPWRYFIYRNRDGKVLDRMLQPPHRWPDLRSQASECEGKEVPGLLRQYPIHYLCFICVYPHRANSSGLRWISTRLQEIGKGNL